MNMGEYREMIRQLPTTALVDKLREIELSIKEGRVAGYSRTEQITDDWQAREVLAELGSRQLSLDA